MKHVKLFESFTSDQTSLKKACELIGATPVAEYYILDIKDLPPGLENTLMVYVPKDNTFRFFDKNLDMHGEDFMSLGLTVGYSGKNKGLPYVQEAAITSKSPIMFDNMIKLSRAEEKGISEPVREFLEEESHSTNNTWDTLVDDLIKSDIEMVDKDYEILGIDKHGKRGVLSAKKYGMK